MTQLCLIDPRQSPIATAEMLDDAGLRAAIATVRTRSGVDPALLWPYVERLPEIGKRPAWAVDDYGRRFVVVGRTVFGISDLAILSAKIRTAATEAFTRLDAAAA